MNEIQSDKLKVPAHLVSARRGPELIDPVARYERSKAYTSQSYEEIAYTDPRDDPLHTRFLSPFAPTPYNTIPDSEHSCFASLVYDLRVLHQRELELSLLELDALNAAVAQTDQSVVSSWRHQFPNPKFLEPTATP